MVRTDPALRDEYLHAYQEWQQQLAALHRVFLEGEPLEPPRLKGLLNREVRAKERYEAVRRKLLGLGDEGRNLAALSG